MGLTMDAEPVGNQNLKGIWYTLKAQIPQMSIVHVFSVLSMAQLDGRIVLPILDGGQYRNTDLTIMFFEVESSIAIKSANNLFQL